MWRQIKTDLEHVQLLQTDYYAIDSDQPLYKVGGLMIYGNDLTRFLSTNNAEEKKIFDLIVKKIIMEDRVDAFKQLIKSGYCSSDFDEKGGTAIHFAFECNFKFLQQDKGTLVFSTTDDLNHTNCYGVSYLHIACALGNTVVAKKYLDNNAGINAQCYYKSNDYDGLSHEKDGFTPLHFAVKHHRYDVVKLLLEYGADVEVKDKYKRTPLYLASLVNEYEYPSCWENDLEIMEILIKYGSNVTIEASIDNFHNLYFIGDGIINKNEFDVETGLFINKSIVVDYRQRQKEKLEMIIRKGADVSLADESGDTILHSVLSNLEALRFPNSFDEISFDDTKYVDMVKLILSANSELASIKTKSGESPLSLAIFYMSLDIVKLLLNYTTDFTGIKFVLKRGTFSSYFHRIPTFECARNFIAIVELFLDREYKLSLKNNLSILKFLIHNNDECQCHVRNLSTPAVLPEELGRAVNFYSPIHTSCLDRIAHESRFTDDFEDLRFNLDLIEYAKLYIDKDIENKVKNLLQEFNVPLVRNLHLEGKLKEVKLMKSSKLRGDVSLYDVMTKHPHDVYPYIQDHICDEKIFEGFDLYEPNIKGHFAKSIIRHYVEKSAYDYLHFSSLSLLPYLCCKRIFYYLNNKEIWNFCFAILSNDLDNK